MIVKHLDKLVKESEKLEEIRETLCEFGCTWAIDEANSIGQIITGLRGARIGLYDDILALIDTNQKLRDALEKRQGGFCENQS